jgi:hypothetical protein
MSRLPISARSSRALRLSASGRHRRALKIDEKTLRKHFRVELSSGRFKIDMTAGKTLVELMRSRDERVRLEATKYYTARRMGWKETTAQQVTGADNGPVKFEDVTPAVDRIRSRISSIAARLLGKSFGVQIDSHLDPSIDCTG